MKDYKRFTKRDKNGEVDVVGANIGLVYSLVPSDEADALYASLNCLADLEDLFEYNTALFLPKGRCNGKTLATKKMIDELAELQEYRQKIEQGRLIELPCKVGNTIFFVYEFGSVVGECFDCDKGIVDGISHQEDGIWVHARYESGLTYWHKEEDVGKTVFLTKTEAEARLQELRGGE